MHYRLRDGLSWCLCGDQAVFLDLPNDRYFRLPREDDRNFQLWSQSAPTERDSADRLVKAHILVLSDEAVTPFPMTSVAPPSAELSEEVGRNARWIDIVRALAAQRKAHAIVRCGRLTSTLAGFECGPGSAGLPTTRGEESVRRIAAAFASPMLGFNKVDQCLPRALAAQALCRAVGVLPTLVFGVRLEPFAAHCWLQWGTKVVVGDLEQARMFTPILTVP